MVRIVGALVDRFLHAGIEFQFVTLLLVGVRIPHYGAVVVRFCAAVWTQHTRFIMYDGQLQSLRVVIQFGVVSQTTAHRERRIAYDEVALHQSRVQMSSRLLGILQEGEVGKGVEAHALTLT